MQAWQATVQDEQGNVVFNPSVTVYLEDGVTLAPIFNEDGSPKANPFIGSLEGFVQFWADSGVYKIVGASGPDSTEVWEVTLGAVNRVYSGYGDFISSSIPASEDVATAIIDGVLISWKRDPSGTVGPTADGGMWSPADEDLSVLHWGGGYQAAIDYALNSGITEVDVPVDMPVPASGSNRSNVIFRGDGSVAGTNENTASYRRRVIPIEAPTAKAFPDVFLPVYAGRNSSSTIVLVGDSLTTYGANTISGSDGLAERLRVKIENDNPGINITFVSRGVGAQRWTDINGVATTSYPIADRYPWYYDDERPWLDYVQDLNPDLVIFSSGMNDQSVFDRTALESVVTKTLAMPSSPKIAFATNMCPNLSPHPDNAQFGSYVGQEGRDSVAGWVRTYAQYYGYPLIDINRTFNIVRDGRDILDTYLREDPEVVFGSASEFLASPGQRCRDFSIKALIDSSAWTNAQPFSVTLCDGGVNTDAGTNAVFINNNGGFLQFRFYRGGAGSLYLTETSNIPTPVGDETVEISVRGNIFSFRIYPTAPGRDAGIQPYSTKVIRYGGLFQPKLWYLGGGGTGPVLSAQLSVGIERPYVPSITDIDMWGIPTSNTGDNREVTGGNGVNHPTSEGTAAIYGLHFSEQKYTIRATVPYAIGDVITARVEGTGSIGAYGVVDGDILWPSNSSGTSGVTHPAGLDGTVWECLGAVIGSSDAGRTTTWRRIG